MIHMVADYYINGFEMSGEYCKKNRISPGTFLFIPASGNLRAQIKSKHPLKIVNHSPIGPKNQHNYSSLFWSKNLILHKKDTYVFETQFISAEDEILPSDHISKFPKWVKENFRAKEHYKINDLAKKLIGDEKDSVKILRRFYNFVLEHLKPKYETTGISSIKLLKEYEKTGYFSGNCKEARNFFISLCNAKGYPSKGATGKSLGIGGHVWAEVFVPVKDGYRLFPIDAAQGYFGHLNPLNHLFIELTPAIKGSPFKRKENYQLIIEKVPQLPWFNYEGGL